MYVLCRYVKVYIFLGTKYGRTCQGRYSDYGDISEAPIHLKKLVSDSARSQKGQHRFWRKVKDIFFKHVTSEALKLSWVITLVVEVKVSLFNYRTRAIITRGLYNFYPIFLFHGLYYRPFMY